LIPIEDHFILNRIFIIVYIFLTTISIGLGQHSLKKIDYPVNSDHLDEICPVVSYDEDILFLQG
jgi:hypothetical protein